MTKVVDPRKAAEQLLYEMELAALAISLMPKADQRKMMVNFMAEFLREMKAAVTDEVLDSQRQTNEALATALNMKGPK